MKMTRNGGQGDGEHLVFQVPNPIPRTGQHQVHYDSWVLPQIPVPRHMNQIGIITSKGVIYLKPKVTERL